MPPPSMPPSLLMKTYLDNVWKQIFLPFPPLQEVKDGGTLSICDTCKFCNV